MTEGKFHPTTREGVSLKEYIDWRFSELQRAVDKAESTMNHRLEGMNEFRESLKDQAAKFVTESDLKAAVAALPFDRHDSDIEELKIARAKMEGMASQRSVTIAFILVAIDLVLGLVGLVVSAISMYK